MSFPRYPKYKDSGVEWLGDVPEHWSVERLKRNVDLLTEKTDRRDHAVALENIESWTGRFIATETEFEGEGIAFRSGDLLFGKLRPYLAKALLAESSGEAVGDFHVMRPTADIDGRFAQYQILSREFIAIVDGSTFGSKMPRASWEFVGGMKLATPPHEEQTLIATFLDRETSKIDALVGEQRRLIELLREKRQAVISHAVTKGLNPDAPMKSSGIEWLGDVPMAWTITKLGRAAFMQEGPGLRNWQFTDDGTRVICVTNITEYGIDFSRLEKFISTDEYCSSYKHFTVQTGDVLLSSSGNSWGKVAIYEGDEAVMLNTSTIRLNESEGRPLIRDFLALLLQSITVREQLGIAMTGSCQPNFGPTHLNSVMIAMPSREEQSEIVAFVARETAKLDALTAEAERGIELLQERRTALISAAVTGKIDVRGFVPQEAA
jgi:type I restriction enzyme S subunit